MTEDYVSFGTAKLLKEKGFDEYYPLWYNLDKPTEGPFFYKEIGWYGHNSYDYNGKRIVSAPTLQMASKWLRKVHNLHCDTGYDDLGWFWNIISVDNTVPVEYRPKMLVNGFAGFDSPEEASEAAIKYCLENLI